jgi:hypothetical protein
MNEAPASLADVMLKPARAARRDKGGDLTAGVAAPAPPMRAAPPADPPPPSRPKSDEPPPRAEEIVLYWERLRRGRALPPLGELDRALVADAWPDSLIVVFDQDALPRISRLGATDGAIEYTPMVTDWILTRARQAARRGTKLDEVQSFPLEGESARYRLFLLPFGPGESVLCHLCRAAW